MGTHRKPRRQTETSDYVAMMERILTGYGRRIAEDPAALVHAKDLQRILAEAVNRGVFEANAGDSAYSMNEIAAMLGVSRQAVQQRVASGRAVYAAEQERLGGGALVRIGDVRARRAELLDAAGVEDSTGSVRELRARAV
jgi:predicted DNA-binding protein YlxM (UPF0122 family)